MTSKKTKELWFLVPNTNFTTKNGQIFEFVIASKDRIVFNGFASIKKEDAEFIIKACNSHYDLLEALKVALKYLPDDKNAVDVQKCLSAIKKANG